MNTTPIGEKIVFGSSTEDMEKPLRGFPEGAKVKVKFHHEGFAQAFYKAEAGIVQTYLRYSECGGYLEPYIIVGFNLTKKSENHIPSELDLVGSVIISTLGQLEGNDKARYEFANLLLELSAKVYG